MQTHILAEPGLTVVQAQEQKFFASFLQKRRPSLPCAMSASTRLYKIA